MSFKALTLAASMLAITTTSGFAGSTTALDIKQSGPSPMTSEMTVPPASGMASAQSVRSDKLQQILRDCRFVTAQDAGHCNFFNSAND